MGPFDGKLYVLCSLLVITKENLYALHPLFLTFCSIWHSLVLKFFGLVQLINDKSGGVLNMRVKWWALMVTFSIGLSLKDIHKKILRQTKEIVKHRPDPFCFLLGGSSKNIVSHAQFLK